jgi:hypothetical protein
MAIMYPKNISECTPTDSEKIVYNALKTQLPDDYEVFYSVRWTSRQNNMLAESEADFIVACPEYGFLCLEVKGGTGIHIENNVWSVEDTAHGERKLRRSPYDQAEESMYYFINAFSGKYDYPYKGIYGAGAVFPFYAIDAQLNLDHRDRVCTIDCNDLNNIHQKIKEMFKLWGGTSFGRKVYTASHHNALLELIRERIAISAASGALVKYKEQQFETINRVQDNYVYFLNNVRQFYIRGGAGTGKTWIAMKMAVYESTEHQSKVLFVCSSPLLAEKVKGLIGAHAEVIDTYSLFEKVIENFETCKDRLSEETDLKLRSDTPKYDAVFVDEAQDFCAEWAKVIRKLLVDDSDSRLGVFYDDVQILRKDSFGEGFGIDSLPYLLHENIRNTANIYNWAAEKTNLGTDVTANPIEGPTPTTEYIRESGQLTIFLETNFKKNLKDENLPNGSLVLLTDDADALLTQYSDGIAAWNLVHGAPASENNVSVYSVEEFKGLEADMVIYIHDRNTSANMNYIAYTRAKYYLIELVRNY